jgi:tetratricopeptide (TPR) repeat protein
VRRPAARPPTRRAGRRGGGWRAESRALCGALVLAAVPAGAAALAPLDSAPAARAPVASGPLDATALLPPPALALPELDLAGVDAAVRGQLGALRRRVEQLSAAGADPRLLAEAYGELGAACLVYALRTAATSALAEAQSRAPDDPRWPYYLGVAHEEDGRLDEAARHLARALELAPVDRAALLRLARVELARHQLPRARALYERALAHDPDSAAAHHGLGRIARLEGDPRQAVERYARALELQPAAGAVHYELALAYRDLGRAEESRAHLARRGPGKVSFPDPLMERLGSLAVGSAHAMARAASALAAGRADEAVRWYRVAVDQAPGDRAALGALASVLAASGRVAEAIELYRRVLELDPEDHQAHYNLGSLLARGAAGEEGIAHLRRAVELAPRYVDAHVNLAVALDRLGRHDEAMVHYDRALALDPEAADVRVGRARLRLRLGDTAAATVDLREVASRAADPSQRAAALALLGSLQLRQGADAEAIAALREAVALDAGLLPARLELARALARQQRWDEIVVQLDAALAVAPRTESAHLARALALLMDGRDAEARRGLERGLELLPDSVALLHSLARVLATSPADAVREPARAFTLAQQVFEREATLEHGETVAMALAGLGRFEGAAALQRTLVARAESTGAAPALLAPLRRRLADYERRRAVRAPWLARP